MSSVPWPTLPDPLVNAVPPPAQIELVSGVDEQSDVTDEAAPVDLTTEFKVSATSEGGGSSASLEEESTALSLAEPLLGETVSDFQLPNALSEGDVNRGNPASGGSPSGSESPGSNFRSATLNAHSDGMDHGTDSDADSTTLSAGAAAGSRVNAGDADSPSSQSGSPSSNLAFGGESAAPVATYPLTVQYDFRDLNGQANGLTAEQQAVVESALNDWSEALNGVVRFERNESAADEEIVTIGVGDLSALNVNSSAGGTLALGQGALQVTESGERTLTGSIWLDRSEAWSTTGTPDGEADTIDTYTVVSHEIGHLLGLENTGAFDSGAMNPLYDGVRSAEAIRIAVAQARANGEGAWVNEAGYEVGPFGMSMGDPQLMATEVDQLLDRASLATASEDAIIAVVDRNGRILGVRVEQDVLDTIADPDTLVFAIDGAVAKARTAAFFSNGDPTNVDSFSPTGTLAPLTSRLVQFLSQSTVTEREVDANPNIPDLNSTERGPGFVAPIGIGGHFPPDVRFTPPVDLFAIEHTNRDSLTNPGLDGIRGTADDYELRGRFNIDPTYVDAGQELYAPESYGVESGLMPNAQSRGIATLPGGIPLFRDTNGDAIGDTLVGGIGVFFPGSDGTALFEQNFLPGVGQTQTDRVNAPKVLEAEYIAFAAAGGSVLAEGFGAEGAKIGAIGGVDPVECLDMPFGRIDLVGIQLPILGPTAGVEGAIQLLNVATTFGGEGVNSGQDQIINTGGDLYADGKPVPSGWLVNPHDSAVAGELTAAEVEQIITQAIDGAEVTRAAIRLTNSADPRPGSRTRMVFAVTDSTGEILGLYRMQDATVFSIDVAVAKARNVSYYADPAALQPEDQVPGVDPGVAFSNRTFRFLAEPRYPAGIDGTQPPVFSILNDPGINPATGENIGAPRPASDYTSVLGYDAFNPMTNFRDPGDVGVVAAPTANDTRKANQNGVIFFPGSTPVYDDGNLIGGFGVSGDGVDQDDVVTFLGADGFLPDRTQTLAADQVEVNGVRLPFIKFLRNPFG